MKKNQKPADFGLGEMLQEYETLKAFREKMESLQDVPLSMTDGAKLLLVAVALAEKENPQNNNFRKDPNWMTNLDKRLDADYRKAVCRIIWRMEYDDIDDAIAEAIEIMEEAGVKKYLFGWIEIVQKDYGLYIMFLASVNFNIGMNPHAWAKRGTGDVKKEAVKTEEAENP